MTTSRRHTSLDRIEAAAGETLNARRSCHQAGKPDTEGATPASKVQTASALSTVVGLAFRGGTALYKLHLRPNARYSEDLDLVQVAANHLLQQRWKPAWGRAT